MFRRSGRRTKLRLFYQNLGHDATPHRPIQRDSAGVFFFQGTIMRRKNTDQRESAAIAMLAKLTPWAAPLPLPIFG
jgi:hypothetical protein